MKRAILSPLILGIITVVALLALKVPNITINKIEFVLNACITCVVTLTGFILTSVSIIVGLSGSGIMKEIKRKEGMSELVSRHIVSLVLSLVLLVLFISIGAIIPANNLISSKCLIVGAGISVPYLWSLISTCYYLLSIISENSKKHIDSSDEEAVPEGNFGVKNK